MVEEGHELVQIDASGRLDAERSREERSLYALLGDECSRSGELELAVAEQARVLPSFVEILHAEGLEWMRHTDSCRCFLREARRGHECEALEKCQLLLGWCPLGASG